MDSKLLKSYSLFSEYEELKPKVSNLVSSPIQCLNRELKSSNALRGDFWVFYNYIPARGKCTLVLILILFGFQVIGTK